ncbi:hypothetical protein G6F54_013905 [Rhizopus delemar]|nr:hypothetical protein G6F54_013905 [Rhizopus delemar]
MTLPKSKPPAGRRQRRHPRRQRSEEDPAGVRCRPCRAGKGQGGQRQRPGRAAELGRCRVVHRQPGSAAEPDRHRVQGAGRDQHRRPVAGA